MHEISSAHWICSPEFAPLSPLQVPFAKQNACRLPEHPEALANHHSLVRRTFLLEKLPQSAELQITGDDIYKLYINGIFISQGPAPSYHWAYAYQSFDLLPYLKEGENTIAVHLYYQGLANIVWCSGDLRQGMAAALLFDGKTVLVTDESWLCWTPFGAYTGEIFGYHTQYGENIDFRKIPKGWTTCRFDDSSWASCRIKSKDDHKLVPQEIPGLEIYFVSPKEIQELEPGHFRIDFGQEIVGCPCLSVCGQEGETLTVLCGEELHPDGSVRDQLRCNCLYRETWTLSGGEELAENYDYKAFRYCEIFAQAGTVQEIRARVRHTKFPEDACCFSSSDETLNRIWDICRQAVKYGTQDGYLDCPSREKGQYLGDMLITAKSHFYLTGDFSLYRRALKAFGETVAFHPGMCCIAPVNLPKDFADYSLLFGQQLLTYYRHTGDLSLLKELYPAAVAVLDFFRPYQREDGLLDTVHSMPNLVDWPANLRDGYDFDLSETTINGCHNVINAFFIGAIQTLNEIKDCLGMADPEDIRSLVESYQKAFFRPQTGLYADSDCSDHSALHSNVLPLYFGIADPSAVNSIVNFIEGKGLCCGVYFAYFVLYSLARAGKTDWVYQLIRNESEHSWVNMLREGATTCYEAWGKEQKWNTSLCHPWASAPIPAFIELLAGISPVSPQEGLYQADPHFPAGLDFTLSYSVPKGKILLSVQNGKLVWKTEGDVRIY